MNSYEKIAILIENMYEEPELLYPYYRLKEEGYEVHLIGPEKDKVYTGKHGYPMKSTHASKDVKAKDYDAVIVPGGYSPDYMRRCNDTINFVKEMDKTAKAHSGYLPRPLDYGFRLQFKGKE
ncbi:ThiJ/PfpI domain-containing protein [Thermoanaerobacter ethanolicus JW 200]|nr:ThiJ/PfpI domain-containing protein [Thermoanaerobacter ethanolicus JW 200]